jgi:hypothetical protein
MKNRATKSIKRCNWVQDSERRRKESQISREEDEEAREFVHIMLSLCGSGGL